MILKNNFLNYNKRIAARKDHFFQNLDDSNQNKKEKISPVSFLINLLRQPRILVPIF